MHRRLYFLLPTVAETARAVDELLLARVGANQLHVLGREGVDLSGLPEATLWQRSDLLHGLEVGLFAGGLTGVLAGLLVLWFPPEGLPVGAGILLALGVVGAVFGAWAAGLIGLDVRNSQLKGFVSALDRGQILMMVDVPRARVTEINAMIRRDHPAADVRGTEPEVPVFP